ncbi:MAG: hypothetical protein N2C14_01435 [Planctomycetales bacterium]
MSAEVNPYQSPRRSPEPPREVSDAQGTNPPGKLGLALAIMNLVFQWGCAAVSFLPRLVFRVDWMVDMDAGIGIALAFSLPIMMISFLLCVLGILLPPRWTAFWGLALLALGMVSLKLIVELKPYIKLFS